MKICVIHASLSKNKNPLWYEAVCKAAGDVDSSGQKNEVINFDCFADYRNTYSGVEISVAVGMLLNRGFVDYLFSPSSMTTMNQIPWEEIKRARKIAAFNGKSKK